jgi:hypothetical protein
MPVLSLRVLGSRRPTQKGVPRFFNSRAVTPAETSTTNNEMYLNFDSTIYGEPGNPLRLSCSASVYECYRSDAVSHISPSPKRSAEFTKEGVS